MPISTAAAIIGGTVLGVGASIYGASASASAAEDQYNAQYSAEMDAAYANAEANIARAEAEAAAIYGGAALQAQSAREVASAQAKGILGASEASADAQRYAAELQQGVDYKNIDLMRREANEALRMLENEQDQYHATSTALAGASGGAYTGTTSGYLDTMDAEQQKQFDWYKNAYASQQAVARENADSQYKASMAYADALIAGAGFEAEAARAAASSMANAYLGSAALQAGAVQAGAQIGYDQVVATYGAQNAASVIAEEDTTSATYKFLHANDGHMR